ncbi:TrmB family transcriptional regulator [Zooshikella ganghwensis]|uniref:Transcriptional regulator n=1 Tax=Zooshikella ganghwensis TaxID=202772 RepID=A0A4P9VKV9_9GAMM|nr:helix-turn-helix domain-containing protein [Zooshikella ganghwensis]RDH42947.1 transcriptional regulator [Zooshikella ganghwensis]
MNIKQVLAQLDFEAREVDIYCALLTLGTASIRDIAEQSGINRGTTHEILKNLLKRGIVSFYPKGKRRHFCAESPEKLIELANDKQEKLRSATRQLVHDVIPDLNRMRSDTGSPQVKYYEGDDGIESVLKDILNTADKSESRSYDVYSSKAIRKYLYRPFPHYTLQRVKRNIRVRAIAIGEGGEDAPLSERKWIDDGDAGGQASYVAIYPPKCAMISLQEGNYPTAVVIESAAISQALKLSFNTLWMLL